MLSTIIDVTYGYLYILNKTSYSYQKPIYIIKKEIIGQTNNKNINWLYIGT